MPDIDIIDALDEANDKEARDVWAKCCRNTASKLREQAAALKARPGVAALLDELAALDAKFKPALDAISGLTREEFAALSVERVRKMERIGLAWQAQRRAIEKRIALATATKPAKPEPEPVKKRGGRKKTADSEMCREAAFAALDTHPTLENYPADLARELGGQASESQARRYIVQWQAKRTAEIRRQREAAEGLAKMRSGE